MWGLVSIGQTNIIQGLTIVSVVGVPPTLVASMYGMNFRHMPELDWAWGYPYGLALIALSAIAPLAWFKWRGWLLQGPETRTSCRWPSFETLRFSETVNVSPQCRSFFVTSP